MYNKIILIFSFTILIFGLSLYPKEAILKQEKRVFKTYPFYDPDPIPKPGRIYPYFKFDGYSKKGKNQEWQVITLENPYIKVYITPQIGGKIWGAFEKSSNRSFIYFNQVVKFRNIAMRGPWTSGGIEMNFGSIGHAPTCSTPVDYDLKKNPDGSVSCVIGAMDLPSRTQWRVNIKLPGNKAFFETESLWYNPSPFRQSYYHWMNAAAKRGDDLKFFYPGTHFIDHSGKVYAWPKDIQGRDISVYKNNNFSSHKSYHVLAQYTEHFGGYWEKSKFGFGNWSSYDDKPGKKLWLWALSRQGEIWKDLLTDKENDQYIEFQSGRLLNQANSKSSTTPFKHAYFDPLGIDQWKEIWFPFKEIGGMVEANPNCVLNVQIHNNILHLGICALKVIDDQLTIQVGDSLVFSHKLNLQPMGTFKKELKLPHNSSELLVSIKNNMEYNLRKRNKKILKRPLVQNIQPNPQSAEALFIKGEELARQRDYEAALEVYLKCLKSQPAHINAICRLAELYSRRGDLYKALQYAQKALSIDTYHGGANFIYGVINSELGLFTDAIDGFGWASRSLQYRSAAYTQMAGLYLREKNLDQTKNYALKALDFNAFNLTAIQLLVITNRMENQPLKIRKYFQKILNIDPINHFVGFEKYLLNPSQENLSLFTGLIRNELPQETFLELALFYANLGLKVETIKLLEFAPTNPIIELWLGYLKREDPGQGDRHLENALKLSPYLVFPFRRETIPVIRWAIKEKNHWKTYYYLALILWNKGRIKEAFDLLKSCGHDPDFYPFYISRGNLSLEISKKKNICHAYQESSLSDFKKALKIKSDQWRTWDRLFTYYINHGLNRQALETSENAYKFFPQNYILAMNLARAMLENKKYKQCLSILHKTTILPYEGAREGRNIYRQANILYAAESMRRQKYYLALKYIEKSRLWPENLGVGKPYSPDERLENYLAALCYEKKGDLDRMGQFLNDIYLYTKKNWKESGAFHEISILALKKMGKEEEAQKLINLWNQTQKLSDWESSFLKKVLNTINTK
jgi:tetratricopeptide (TPR) repeat protein